MIYKIDKYIVKAFVPSFIVCMFAICGIYIVVDAIQKIDDFIEMGAKAFTMSAHYYGLMVPVFIAQLFPAITLVSVSLVLVRFVKNNEILAMQVAGINLYRIMLPIFIVSVFLSLLAVINQELIIPKLAEELEKVEQTTFEEKEQYNILIEDEESRMLFSVWALNVSEGILKSVYIIGKYENGKKKFTIRAERGKWTDDNNWLLFNVVKHDYDESGDWVAPTLQMDNYLLETTLSPAELSKVDINASLKSFKELRELRDKEPENDRYSVMYYTRVAYPLTNFILLFLGIPVVLGFERMSKNIFLRVGISVLICCAFFVLAYICANLGNMGILQPVLAAWIPVIVFGCLGLILFDGMRI
ncbi:MAG: LptF/LptG family permease [Candidatus Scalindua rubra]|uniref:Putative transporter protein n=1 Tax=Candidatus Scalindua brodae TaxID=237368 RepID=A0A0B0EDF3_9BACT|nr:MAG: putative transporter protein [Candidatus Scalindua brodae]MBZ0110117.1 LptF/LptG family permease [Candidatus Scalindua rubra]TWU36991.1 putative permease YjgP/YjgQ family protein [Candidatus Brocadiaceae bacterium S225]